MYAYIIFPYYILSGNLVAQAEGLPNINGGPWSSEYGETCSGAVYMNGHTKGEKGGASGTGDTMYLDAARSSSIYGASSHVTPVNFTYRIWKRIS